MFDLQILRRKARKLSREMGKILKHRGDRLTPNARQVFALKLAELNQIIGEDCPPEKLKSAMDAVKREYLKHERTLKRASFIEYVQSLGVALIIALFIRAFIIEAFKIPTGSMIPTLEIGDHIFVAKFSFGLRIPFTNIRLVEWGKPERGDVVVFEYPGEGEDKGKDFIKRVVAVEGDRVRLKNNRLVINGEDVPTTVIESGVDCRDEKHSECSCVRLIENLDGHEHFIQHFSPTDMNDRCINHPDWPTENDLRQFGGRRDNPDFPDVVVPQGHVLCMGDNRDNSSDGRYWGFVPLENLRGKALFIWWPPNRIFKKVQ